MSKIFNEYGNIHNTSLLKPLELTIEDTVKDYIDEAVRLNASIVELRALEAYLMATVGITFAENRLQKQFEQKAKKEIREKKYINYYSCRICATRWERTWNSEHVNSCISCGMGMDPYRVEKVQ